MILPLQSDTRALCSDTIVGPPTALRNNIEERAGVRIVLLIEIKLASLIKIAQRTTWTKCTSQCLPITHQTLL
eukprot:SAG31_NODE_32290_length_357_cov_1.205426_1_plen_72_part_01